MKSFNEWMRLREASAFTRSRRSAALGTGPSIPDAAINSRSTAAPWEKDRIVKRNKKRKKKKKS